MVQGQCCNMLLGHSTTFQGQWWVFCLIFYLFYVARGTTSTTNPIGLGASMRIEVSHKISN
jgi:hypothetical protein